MVDDFLRGLHFSRGRQSQRDDRSPVPVLRPALPGVLGLFASFPEVVPQNGATILINLAMVKAGMLSMKPWRVEEMRKFGVDLKSVYRALSCLTSFGAGQCSVHGCVPHFEHGGAAKGGRGHAPGVQVLPVHFECMDRDSNGNGSNCSPVLLCGAQG